jgi:hypothetical protein
MKKKSADKTQRRGDTATRRHNDAGPEPVTAAAPSLSRVSVSPRRRVLVWAGCLALVLAGVGVYWFYPRRPAGRPVGPATECQKVPPFVASLGFDKPALSTSERAKPGLWVIEAKEKGRRYQHPSWKAAGFLAPIERDAGGNVYVAPAATVNTLLNPPAEQNVIWRVDGQTQRLEQFVTLPQAAPTNEQNVFGALGLAYDCETQNLYVASVFGSTRSQEAGRIYRVDTQKRSVAAQLAGVDAMGLRIFYSSAGKRLYYGLARQPEVWSVDLDADGNFTGTPRREISLAGLGPRGNDKARRINFLSATEAAIFGVEFDFNLIAPTEKQETVYRFRYDPLKDTWQYVPEPAQIVQ